MLGCQAATAVESIPPLRKLPEEHLPSIGASPRAPVFRRVLRQVPFESGASSCHRARSQSASSALSPARLQRRQSSCGLRQLPDTFNQRAGRRHEGIGEKLLQRFRRDAPRAMGCSSNAVNSEAKANVPRELNQKSGFLPKRSRLMNNRFFSASQSANAHIPFSIGTIFSPQRR